MMVLHQNRFLQLKMIVCNFSTLNLFYFVEIKKVPAPNIVEASQIFLKRVQCTGIKLFLKCQRLPQTASDIKANLLKSTVQYINPGVCNLF